MKTHAADCDRKEFCLFLDLQFMVFFVVSYFRDFVIKDLFLFRFIRVGRYNERKNKNATEAAQCHHAGTQLPAT